MRYPSSSMKASAASKQSKQPKQPKPPSLLYKTSSLMKSSSPISSSSLLIDSSSNFPSLTSSSSNISPFALIARIRIARDSIFLKETIDNEWLYADCESSAREAYDIITEKIIKGTYNTQGEFINDISNFEKTIKMVDKLPVGLLNKIHKIITDSVNALIKSNEINQSVSRSQDTCMSSVFSKLIDRSKRYSKSQVTTMKILSSVFYHGALQGSIIAGPHGKNTIPIWKIVKKKSSPESKAKNGINEKKRSANEANDTTTTDHSTVKNKIRKDDDDEYEPNHGKKKIRKYDHEYLNPVTLRNINKYKDETLNTNNDDKVLFGRSRGRSGKLDKALDDLKDDDDDDDDDDFVPITKALPKGSKPQPKPTVDFVGIKKDQIGGSKWQAFIKVPTQSKVIVVHLKSTFDTAAEAAKAHDFALIRAMGASVAAKLAESSQTPVDKLNFPIADYAQEPNEKFCLFDAPMRHRLFGTGWQGASVPDFSFLMIKNKTNNTKSNTSKIQLDQVNKLLGNTKQSSGARGRPPMSLTNSVSINIAKENKVNAKQVPQQQKAIAIVEPVIGSMIQVFEESDPHYPRHGVIMHIDKNAIGNVIIAFHSGIERKRGHYTANKPTKLYAAFALIDEKDYSETDLVLLNNYRTGKYSIFLQIMQSNEKLKECNFPSDFDNGENHNYNGNSHKDAMPLLKTKENGQCHNESKLVIQPKIKETKKPQINDLAISHEMKTMCDDISVNISVILGEELLHIKNKFLSLEKSTGQLDIHASYPHVECEWEKVFKSRAIKAYNDDCLIALREKLEELAMDNEFNPIFKCSLSGIEHRDEGFVIEFESQSKFESIKYFRDDISAAIVREQILDKLGMTTINESSYYTATNFTYHEWSCLKKMRDLIIEFGKIYRS